MCVCERKKKVKSATIIHFNTFIGDNRIANSHGEKVTESDIQDESNVITLFNEKERKKKITHISRLSKIDAACTRER